MTNKNNIFSHKSYYYLKEYFSSTKVPLLISQLEYWFSREKFKKGFFKFLEPCPHRLYKSGDSWAEQLGWKRDLFKRVFDIVGHRYNSKTDYFKALQGGDPFQNKLYISYYDRKSNRTFFLRNHSYADAFFTKPSTSSPSSSNSSSENMIYNSSAQSCKEQKTYSLIENNNITYNFSSLSSYSSNFIQEENIKKSLREKLRPVLKIWQDIIGPIRDWIYQKSFLEQIQYAFSQYFHNCLNQWKSYCLKIASSKFLMGEVSSFKVWIIRASKPEFIQRIQEDGFTLGDRSIPCSTQEKIKIRQKKDHCNKIFETLSHDQQEDLKQAYLESQKNPGIIQSIKLRGWTDPIILSWFKDFCLDYIEKNSLENFTYVADI